MLEALCHRESSCNGCAKFSGLAASLPLHPGSSFKESWLAIRDKDGHIEWCCVACASRERPSTPYGVWQLSPLKLCNLQRHASSTVHCQSIASMLQAPSPPIPDKCCAQPSELWHACLQYLCKGGRFYHKNEIIDSTGTTRFIGNLKLRRMAWCLRNGYKSYCLTVLQDTKCINLLRDESKWRLDLRLQACGDNLVAHKCFHGTCHRLRLNSARYKPGMHRPSSEILHIVSMSTAWR